MSIYALLGSLKIVYKKKRLNFKNIFQVTLFQKTYSNARSSIIKEVRNCFFGFKIYWAKTKIPNVVINIVRLFDF